MNFKMAGISHQARSRSPFIGHPDATISCRTLRLFKKKEKEAKRKKGERGQACGNCRNCGNPAEKRGFPQLLGKASQDLLGFSTVTTGPTAVNINHSSLLIVLSHEWGSLHLIPNSSFLIPNSCVIPSPEEALRAWLSIHANGSC